MYVRKINEAQKAICWFISGLIILKIEHPQFTSHICLLHNKIMKSSQFITVYVCIVRTHIGPLNKLCFLQTSLLDSFTDYI